MKVLYGICSWGLGHATRSLPVIRKLVSENNKLMVISSGRSIDLLKTELGDDVKYSDIPDYPMLVSENSRQFMAKSLIYWPLFIRKMESGLQTVTKLVENNKYDLIISDARYDVYSKKIPSYFISHQMRIMNPLRIKKLESGSEIFNLFFFKRFREVIVPDFKDDNLSGDLSHNLNRIDESKINYVGILSDFSKKRTKKDIDYFISISGPEPQRTLFEKKILSQIDQLDGNIVITLGKTEINEKLKNENITTHTFLSKKEREELLNRTKLVISRSGYSTILDLAVIGTKALMVPTPGQIEQEYLGQYHVQKRSFFSVSQEQIDLKKNVEKAKGFTGIKKKCDVNLSVNNIMEVIYHTI
ncbi:MAG: glycosyltransferase [Candidatus Thermoplasmatota archaeon]|nr:glycosyltransferase [Candidatus Thermoplasmatota archaeon]